MNTQVQAAVHMCGFNSIQRGEPIRRTEVQVRVERLKNGKAAGKNKITGEIIKGGGGDNGGGLDLQTGVWNFESGVMAEDWRSAAIFHCTRVMQKGLNVRTKAFSLLSVKC